MRILVVDDDLVARTQIKSLFAAYGNTDAAQDGESALALFEKAHAEGAPYGLIALDVHMPGLSGQDVIKRIRQWEAERSLTAPGLAARILMISARGDRNNITSSFKEGCEGYLIKPVTPEKLEITLRQIPL
jgi:two-component system, chemotaxis family, chemotaxis protein CheY